MVAGIYTSLESTSASDRQRWGALPSPLCPSAARPTRPPARPPACPSARPPARLSTCSPVRPSCHPSARPPSRPTLTDVRVGGSAKHTRWRLFARCHARTWLVMDGRCEATAVQPELAGHAAAPHLFGRLVYGHRFVGSGAARCAPAAFPDRSIPIIIGVERIDAVLYTRRDRAPHIRPRTVVLQTQTSTSSGKREGGWLAWHRTIKEMGPPHRLDA